jgi:hypothetical protein
MNIIFPVVVLAFVSFVVWLGVRIVNRRERWAKRMAVGLAMAAFVGYPLSFGPYCWVGARSDDLTIVERFNVVYSPLVGALLGLPESLYGPVEWYLGLGAPQDSKPYFWKSGPYVGLTWNRPEFTYTIGSK